jgi:hypothetical protein
VSFPKYIFLVIIIPLCVFISIAIALAIGQIILDPRSLNPH